MREGDKGRMEMNEKEERETRNDSHGLGLKTKISLLVCVTQTTLTTTSDQMTAQPQTSWWLHMSPCLRGLVQVELEVLPCHYPVSSLS